MRAFYSLILLLGICLKAPAQGTTIDSLAYKLSRATHDTTRVMLMSELAYLYRLSNPDSGMAIANKGLKIAQKLAYRQGESSLLSSLGAIYRIQGDLQTAIALEFNALRIAQQNGFIKETAKAYFGIGNAYAYLRDYRQGIDYLLKAITLFKSLGDTHQYSIVYANIGDVYRQNKQLDSARYYLNGAYELMKKVNYVTGISFCLTRLSRINLIEKQYETARQLAVAASAMGVQQKNIRTQSMSYQLMSDYHKATGNADSAMYYAEKSFEIAKAYNYKWDMLDNSNILADLYQTKDLRKAYYYARLAKSLNDSIYGPDRVIGLQKKVIEEQEAARQKEAEVLAYQNRWRQNLLLAGLGILVLIGLLLFWNNRQKQKANQVLQQTLVELRSTQAQLIQKEKLASLGELTAGIAHEIQNPLNFVNNFSELSVELLDELKSPLTPDGEIKENERVDMELLGDIVQNLEKINLHGKRASSIVKGMLEHSRASTGERQPTDINQLADEYLRLSYHGMRAKDKQFNADYELIADPALPKVNVVPQDIGRVLLNLINNAFHAVHQRNTVESLHATPQSTYRPSVRLTTQQSSTGIEIRVQDNGPGIPADILPKIFQPFFTTKPTGEGTGLGLSLSYDIVTKGHGGSIEIETKEGFGSMFIVKLPI